MSLDHDEVASRTTIGIPLYRSAEFVERISDNIASFIDHGYEIIVSDRHGYDDTLELLNHRYSGSDGVRFVDEQDELSWIEHYNALFHLSSREYVCIVPHDDEFMEPAVRALARALDKNPDAVLAFGGSCPISKSGVELPWHTTRFLQDTYPTNADRALGFFADFSGRGVPFHGLFRKQLLKEHEIRLRKVKDHVFSDLGFVFECLLVGSAVEVEDLMIRKHGHETNISAAWGTTTASQIFSLWVLMSRTLRRSSEFSGAGLRHQLVLLWHTVRSFLRFSPTGRWVSAPYRFLKRSFRH